MVSARRAALRPGSGRRPDACWDRASGRALVPVVQAADLWPAADLADVGRHGRAGGGRVFVEGEMRAGAKVVVEVPVYLALSFAAFGAGTVVLLIAAHPTWAILTAVSAVLVAVPLTGWIVARPFLEADSLIAFQQARRQ